MDPVFLVLPLVVAAIVSFGVVKVIEKPITAIFGRIIKDEISQSFVKYVKLVTYLVGISRGVRIFQLYEDVRKLTTDNQDLDLELHPMDVRHIWNNCRNAASNCSYLPMVVFVVLTFISNGQNFGVTGS